MPYRLLFSADAAKTIGELEVSNPKKLKRVHSCLGKLQENPRHPGLECHLHHRLSAQHGMQVYEAYVENKTPSAWRVFWTYGPGRGEITVLSITPHP